MYLSFDPNFMCLAAWTGDAGGGAVLPAVIVKMLRGGFPRYSRCGGPGLLNTGQFSLV